MLNRRTLRVKIMQSLFAFEQCKEANYHLGMEEVETTFKPDMTSMEIPDKTLLAELRIESKEHYEKRFKNSDEPNHSRPEIVKAVDKAIKSFARNVKKDQLFFRQNLIAEVERINDFYYSVLGLVAAFAEFAKTDEKKKYENFLTNPWIIALTAHAELHKKLLKTTMGWTGNMKLVRGWFKGVVSLDEEFITYSGKKNLTDGDHKTIVNHLVRKLILSSDSISDFYQHQDIRWAEDKDIIRGLVNKTIKSFDGTTMTLQKLTLDWDDDREFLEKLFEGTVSLNAKYKNLIAKNTKNWEVDRLPLTDRIILEMAIAELVLFANIPVKVTINEYIELAKLYSTPKSRQFVNGILDVIAKELSKSGDLKKSGRGLIDNK